jgi:hypothetical protein
VGCFGVFWAIWSVPLVMTNDGPQAVLTAHMEAHYDDPDSIYARQFSVGFGLSGRGFSILYRPVAAIFSWPNSLRVSQMIIVLSLAFAIGWLCKAVSREKTATPFASLLGFAVAFSWPFYMGFYAFTVSMTVGLMVLAFAVSKPQGLTALQKAAVSTVLLVQVFLHGFAVFITLALLMLVVMTRALAQRKSTPPAEWRRASLREAAWLAVSAVPSVGVLLVMRTAQAEMATVAGSLRTEWASPSDWARVLPRVAVPGSTPLGIVVVVVALIAIARTVLRVRREPGRPEELALVIGAIALLAAAIVMPLHVPGWQFFAPRFLTTGLGLSFCLLGCEKLEQRPARLAFDVGVVALVASALVSARALHHRLATACEDALAGLDHTIGRSGFQLPIVFDSNCGLTTENARLDVPYSKVLQHFYALFPVTHGGAVPYGFFGPAAVHAFVPRTSVVPIPPIERYWGAPAEDRRAELLTELAVFGTHYENIVLFGARESDRALLLDRGYVADFEHGSFFNAHHVPCVVEVLSDVLPADPPVAIRGGLREEAIWSAMIAPVAGRRALQGSLSMLCGDGWVSVQWQQSEQRCANADERGRIAVKARRADTARVVCERTK